MNWTVHQAEGQPFIKVVTLGDFNLSDHLKMIEDIVSRGFWKPETKILLDHRNLEFGSTDITSVRRAVDNFQKYEARLRNSKVAIVAKSMADYGRGRQLELVAEGKVAIKFSVFLDDKAAIDWLVS